MHPNSICTLSRLVKKCRQAGFMCPPEFALRTFLQNRQHVQISLDYRCFDSDENGAYVPSLCVVDMESLEQLAYDGRLVSGHDQYIWQFDGGTRT